jgi:hypothetical protein
MSKPVDHESSLGKSLGELKCQLDEHLHSFDGPEHFHVWSGVSPGIAEAELRRSVDSARTLIANFLNYVNQSEAGATASPQQLQEHKTQLSKYIRCLKVIQQKVICV